MQTTTIIDGNIIKNLKFITENLFKTKDYIIAFSGRIYNDYELKAELKNKGTTFTTNRDEEIILAAYDLWKEKCLNKFNGVWAFAIYDIKNNKVFVSRDHFGVKSLYYTKINENLFFSTNIKKLLKLGIKRTANSEVLSSYLHKGIIDYNNETFFENIFAIEPGTYLLWNLKTKDYYIKQYYEIKANKVKITENEAKNKLNTLLENSIKLRIDNKNLGSCLSGGLDSSAIVCLYDKTNNKEIKTLSAVFPGSKINEEKYIDIVTKNTKTTNFKTKPTSKELLKDLDDLIEVQEEPFGSTSIYAQYRVMKLAKEEKIENLLDGQGSDELFGGYHTYFPSYINQLIKDKKIKELAGSKLFWKFFFYYLKKNPKKIINKIFNIKPKSKIYNLKVPALNYPKYVDNYILLCMKTSLRSLLKWEDKNAMRFSIESRLPYLDPTLVEFAFSLPYFYKIKNFETKHIFRKAISEYVPKEIIERKDKIGFATPEKDWFTTKEFDKFIQNIIFSKSFESRTYWNYKEIQKLYYKKNTEYFTNIWKIINTELWLRMFIDPEKF